MSRTKVSSKDLGKARLQDRTDWKRVLTEPQETVDRKISENKDKDNPVLAKPRFHRLKNPKGGK